MNENVSLNEFLQPASVLVAVAPAPLLRVVEHLLGSQPSLRLVARCSDRFALADGLEKKPDIVVISESLLGTSPRACIQEIRRTSPNTKILVIRPGWQFPAGDPDYGADAYVREWALVRRLHALLSKLYCPVAYTVH